MTNKRMYPRLALLLLVVGFVAFSALNTLLFGRVRADLTENRLYTISDGTREILHSIDEPLDLHFFFSDKATRDAAMKKMVEDPRMDPSTPGNPPMPFDGKRMIFGGFEQVVEVKA